MDLRHAIEQSCDVYFYTLGKMVGVDKINKWATRLGLGVKSGIDLPNEVDRARAVERVEAAAVQGAVVPGRDDLGGDRPGAGDGDAGLDGRLHGSARPTAARRVTPHVLKAVDEGKRLEAGPDAGGAGRGRDSSPRRSTPSTTGCGWWSTRGAPAETRGCTGYDVSGKTGTVQVISLDAAPRR